MEPVGLRSSSLAQIADLVGGREPRQPDQRRVADRGQRGVVAHQRIGPPAAGDGRQDRDAVAVGELGGDAVEEADVLVVEVDVHEAAQLAAVDEALADAGVAALQVGEELGEGRALALDGLLAVGVGAEDGRDADLDGHGWCSCRVKWAGARRARWRGAACGVRGRGVRRAGASGSRPRGGGGQRGQIALARRHRSTCRRATSSVPGVLVAHVVDNHALIVTIPGPDPRCRPRMRTAVQTGGPAGRLSRRRGRSRPPPR